MEGCDTCTARHYTCLAGSVRIVFEVKRSGNAGERDELSVRDLHLVTDKIACLPDAYIVL